MANVEFGTGKTVLILTTVAACFAVLWPKIFYPMLVSSPPVKIQSDNGCCDVIFETDVNAIKIMSEMCGAILTRHQDLDPKMSRVFQQGKFSKEIAAICRTEVMDVCGIDIAEFLTDKVRIGQSYKQMLDGIRSFNISVCLRQNFGISLGSIGAPRRMRNWGPTVSRHLRQERPLHLRPEIMHPALREKGRAIPQNNLVPKIVEKEGNARPPPVPGMRPPMGGAGHVVPAPKVGTTMSIVMPLYTIGIVIFSMYTIMKVFIRKTGGSEGCKDFSADAEFRRVVFAEDYDNGCAIKDSPADSGRQGKDSSDPVWKSEDDATRLVMTAITGLLAELDQQLIREGDTQTQYSTDLKEEKKEVEEVCTGDKVAAKSELIKSKQVDKAETDPVRFIGSGRGELLHREDDDGSKPKVKVMGVETVAECEEGSRWSRPATPTLGVGGHARGGVPPPEIADTEPQNIFLEGTLPSQSQLLVTDSKTQTFTLPLADDPEPHVILSGKMTLSLISVDVAAEAPPPPPPPVSLPHNQCEFTSDGSDFFGDADSTLLDIDSVVTDEGSFHSGEAEEEFQEEEAGEERENVNENHYEYMNEKTEEDATTNYTTATMSDGAEASLMAESEDTAADVSNIDVLDAAEDQEELQEDEDQAWNGTGDDNPSPNTASS